jgi:hypothetical protein
MSENYSKAVINSLKFICTLLRRALIFEMPSKTPSNFLETDARWKDFSILMNNYHLACHS